MVIYIAITLGQFTRNYTQTVKRAADNKRRYAPGWVHSTCLLRGFPKGAAPHLAHKCPACYGVRLVVTSCISFIFVQARKLTHFAAPPLPKKSYDFPGTPDLRRMPSILRDLRREGAKLTFISFSWFGSLSHFDTAHTIKMLFWAKNGYLGSAEHF